MHKMQKQNLKKKKKERAGWETKFHPLPTPDLAKHHPACDARLNHRSSLNISLNYLS